MVFRITLLVKLDATVPTTEGQVRDWLDNVITEAIDRLPKDADRIVVQIDDCEKG